MFTAITSIVLMSLSVPPAEDLPPGFVPAERELSDEALIEKLAACEDENCATFLELRGRGPSIWTALLPLVLPAPETRRPPKELTRFWAIGLCAAHRHQPCAEPLKRIIAVGPEPRLRAASAYAIARIMGPPAADSLLLALTDSDINVRFEAASAIGDLRLGDDSVVTGLLATFTDGDGDVRRAAIEALGLGGNPKAVQPLADRLGRETVAMNRGFAAIALGQLRGRAAAPQLIARLAVEEDAEALAAAAWALGELGDGAAVAPLEVLSKHANQQVRESARAALVELKRVPERAPRELPKVQPKKTPGR